MLKGFFNLLTTSLAKLLTHDVTRPAAPRRPRSIPSMMSSPTPTAALAAPANMPGIRLTNPEAQDATLEANDASRPQICEAASLAHDTIAEPAPARNPGMRATKPAAHDAMLAAKEASRLSSWGTASATHRTTATAAPASQPG